MTVKLQCPVCGDYGTLMTKTTVTKIAGKEYRYKKWYIYHNRSKGTKQRWCYLSKKYLELPEIKEAIQKEEATQNSTKTTQNISETNKPNLSSFNNENLPERSLCSYINSILTKTSSGTRTLMILRITRSSASTIISRL